MARYELNLRDYYRIIRRHVVVIAAVSVFLGGMTFMLSPTEPTYRATATVRITRASTLTGLLLQTFYWSPEDNISTQTMLISSQPVLLKVAKRMEYIPAGIELDEAIDNPNYRMIISQLSEKIEARQVEYSGLVNIVARHSSPDTAMQLASNAALAFEEYSREEANKQTYEARVFIEGQLTLIRTRLDSAQQAMKEFREASLPYSTADIASLTPLLNRRRTLQDRINFLEEQKQRLMEGTGTLLSQGTILGAGAMIPYADTYGQFSTLLTERERLLITYTEAAEPVRAIDKQIREMREQLLVSFDQDAQMLWADLDEVDQLLSSYPDEEIRLASLTRSVELNTELVTQLETSLQEAHIREAETPREISVINFPTTAASDQQSGRGLKTIIGLLLGLMLGIVMAFVLETMDTSIGTIEDVEEYLEIPVLAVIPHLDVDKMAARLVDENPQLADNPNLDMFARLITQYDPRSPAAEAYRTLRTNLQFAIAGAAESLEAKNTFVFTSSSLQEGKTTTIVNLAITVAQAGNRVLLLGCNLRRPTIYKSFGLSIERGMTDILTGQRKWQDCIKSVTDMMVGHLSLQNIMSMPGLDNLHIITSGAIPPNPSELLNSPRFGELIEEVRKEYDLVLIDCSPILPVTDSAIVGSQVDWSVLIYQVGKVPRNALRRAKFHMTNVGAHVLGIAMNDVKAEISGYSPYSQYMTKYYGEEAKARKTLLQRLRDRLSKKPGDSEERRTKKRSLLHMGRDEQEVEEAAWIDVKYSEEEEEEGRALRDDLSTLPFSRATDYEPTQEAPAEPDTMPPPAFGDESIPEVAPPGIGPTEIIPPDTALTSETDELETERREGPKYSRIPLWGCIILGALIVILVLSIVFGLWSGIGSDVVMSEPGPEIQETVAQPSTQQSRQPSAPPTTGPSQEAAPSAGEVGRSGAQPRQRAAEKIWSVQVGSFRTLQEAESLTRRLSAIEYLNRFSYWTRAEEVPNLGIWYRVFTGQYSDMEACVQVAQLLRESQRVSITMIRSVLPPTP